MPSASTILPLQLLLAASTLYANQENIYALDVTSGMIYQSYTIPGMVCLTIANDILYLNINRGSDYLVQALRKNDGHSLWSYQVEGRLSQAPVVVDGVVYASIVEGSIYALQAIDGTLLWRSTINLGDEVPSYLGPLINNSPTIINGNVYITPIVNSPLKPFLYAFRAKDGTLLWQTPIPDASAFPLAVADGIFYLSTSHGCSALHTNDGSVLWQQDLGTSAQVYSRPVILNGRVYFSYSELRMEFSSLEPNGVRHWEQALICALQSSDGSLLWQQSLNGATPASHSTELVVIDDVLCIGTNDGILSAYRSNDGIPLWHYQTGGAFLSSPTGANGTIYVSASDGYVYAFRVANGALLWQTPVHTTGKSASGISLLFEHISYDA